MKLTNSQGIDRLIRLAQYTPGGYRRLVICAPFISEELLRKKAAPTGVVKLPTIVITRPETASRLIPICRSWRGPISIASLPNLHANVYLACGKDERDTVAMLGSFNLTVAAMDVNFELGARLTGRSPEYRHQLLELERTLLRLSRVEMVGVNL
jgi:hypothetical protein